MLEAGAIALPPLHTTLPTILLLFPRRRRVQNAVFCLRQKVALLLPPLSSILGGLASQISRKKLLLEEDAIFPRGDAHSHAIAAKRERHAHNVL